MHGHVSLDGDGDRHEDGGGERDVEQREGNPEALLNAISDILALGWGECVPVIDIFSKSKLLDK